MNRLHAPTPVEPTVIGFSAKVGLAGLARRLHGQAPDYLAPPELAFWQAVPSAKRRLEYAGGRLAAKLAVHALRRWQGQPPLPLAELPVLPLPGGEPRVRLPDGSEYALSLSHAAGLACAASFLPAWRLGIDLISQGRAPPHDEAWCHSTESRYSVSDRAISWAVKEATVKTLGKGMGPVFREIRCWRDAQHRWVSLPTQLMDLRKRFRYTLFQSSPYFICIASVQMETI